MIKTFVMAWVIGTVSLFVIGLAVVLSVGLVATIGEWNSFTIGLGPVEFLKHTHNESVTGIETGWALVPAAIILGLLNGLGAVYFRARSKPTA